MASFAPTADLRSGRGHTVPFRAYGGHTVPFRAYGGHTVPFRAYGGHTVPFRAYGGHTVPFRAYGGHTVPFRAYGGHTVPFRAYGGHTVPSAPTAFPTKGNCKEFACHSIRGRLYRSKPIALQKRERKKSTVPTRHPENSSEKHRRTQP